MINFLSPALPPPTAHALPSGEGGDDGLFLRALGPAAGVEAPVAEEEEPSGDAVCAAGEAAGLPVAAIPPPPSTAPAEGAEVTEAVSHGPTGAVAPSGTGGLPAAPLPGPATAAPPPPAAPVATADQPAPSGPAPVAGASESALRFRLADAGGPQPDDGRGLSAPADASGPEGPAAHGPDLSFGDGVTADLPPSSAPADPPRARPAAAAPPHHQAAAHLADLIRDHGADVTSASGRTEIVLSPEELGRIRFDLRSSPDGLSVTLSADRPETLDLLRRHATELRAELSAAGYDLATLDFGTAGGNRGNSATPAPATGIPDDPAIEPPALPALPHRGSMSGGLDLRL